MTSGIALDRPDRLSLKTFPYDRFKIDMIVPIVRIELNSIQAIEVVSVVWVVFPYDRPDRLNIFWDDWDDLDDHMKTRLYDELLSFFGVAAEPSVRSSFT